MASMGLNRKYKDHPHASHVIYSDDEGKTWGVSRVIHKGSSAYSCLTRLPDKSIGLFYERDGYAKVTFANFTLDWLTGGKDKRAK